jgi:polygalacturonase
MALYDVTAHGATGNGVTDDAAAIQALINQFGSAATGPRSQ